MACFLIRTILLACDNASHASQARRKHMAYGALSQEEENTWHVFFIIGFTVTYCHKKKLMFYILFLFILVVNIQVVYLVKFLIIHLIKKIIKYYIL